MGYQSSLASLEELLLEIELLQHGEEAMQKNVI